MTKGIHEPKFYKGFTKEELDGYKSRWVQRDDYVAPTGNQAIFMDWQEQNFFKIHDEEEGLAKDLPSDEVFPVVKRAARQFIFARNNRIWDQRTIMQYKMIVLTHCMRQQIPIPSNCEWGKWL